MISTTYVVMPTCGFSKSVRISLRHSIDHRTRPTPTACHLRSERAQASDHFYGSGISASGGRRFFAIAGMASLRWTSWSSRPLDFACCMCGSSLDHGRRELLHFGVTAQPTSAWVVQQLREAFPDETALRFLIYDNDSIFSASVTEVIGHLGIKPKRTAYRSPWQNGTAAIYASCPTWSSSKTP